MATQQINLVASTTAAPVAGAIPPRGSFLIVQDSSRANNLAFTLDGSTPVIDVPGTTVGNGFQLGPLGSITIDSPLGATWSGTITVVASAANTPVTILVGTP